MADELTALLAQLPPSKVSSVLAVGVEWTKAGLSPRKVEAKVLELARLMVEKKAVALRRLTGSEASKAAAQFELLVKREVLRALAAARKELPMRELEERLRAHPHDVPSDLLEKALRKLEEQLA